MDPERKLALLMGASGALSFGVLYQGYVLVGGTTFDPLVLLTGMAIAAAITTMLAPGLRRAIVAQREARADAEKAEAEEQEK